MRFRIIFRSSCAVNRLFHFICSSWFVWTEIIDMLKAGIPQKIMLNSFKAQFDVCCGGVIFNPGLFQVCGRSVCGLFDVWKVFITGPEPSFVDFHTVTRLYSTDH